MKWLQDNPVGLALTALSGLFALLGLVMAIVWSMPVEVELTENDKQETGDEEGIVTASEVAAISNFQVIVEKPVFNESRQPVVEEEDKPEEAEDVAIEVKDAPKVKLTGVIITPGLKIASLTPADAELESVMAHEGQALTGDFVGWQVGTVNPRAVILESRDGRKLELELEIHDVTIKEPPKPVRAEKTAEADAEKDQQMVDEEGEPLSRAEQIRQRIAERREELRLEQEAQQAQNNNKDRSPTQSALSRKKYEAAIRALEHTRKEESSNDNKDG
jgi:hypothetical protein